MGLDQFNQSLKEMLKTYERSLPVNIPFRENHPAHPQLHDYVSRKYDGEPWALVPPGPMTTGVGVEGVDRRMMKKHLAMVTVLTAP